MSFSSESNIDFLVQKNLTECNIFFVPEFRIKKSTPLNKRIARIV
jgi:hypothetical protein